jgi:hypothetical protein
LQFVDIKLSSAFQYGIENHAGLEQEYCYFIPVFPLPLGYISQTAINLYSVDFDYLLQHGKENKVKVEFGGDRIILNINLFKVVTK